MREASGKTVGVMSLGFRDHCTFLIPLMAPEECQMVITAAETDGTLTVCLPLF